MEQNNYKQSERNYSSDYLGLVDYMDTLLDTNILYYWSGLEHAGRISVDGLDRTLSSIDKIGISDVALLEVYGHFAEEPAKIIQLLNFIKSRNLKVIPYPNLFTSDLRLNEARSTEELERDLPQIISIKKFAEISVFLHYLNSFTAVFASYLETLEPLSNNSKIKNYAFHFSAIVKSNQPLLLAESTRIVEEFYQTGNEAIFKSDSCALVGSLCYVTCINYHLAANGLTLQQIGDISEVGKCSSREIINTQLGAHQFTQNILRVLNSQDYKHIAQNSRLWLQLDGVIEHYYDELQSIGKGLTKYLSIYFHKTFTTSKKIRKNDLLDALHFSFYPNYLLLTFDKDFLSIIREADESYAAKIDAFISSCNG